MLSAYLQEARRHESQIARLSLTSKDCTNLMPGEPPDDQARIKALTEESKVLEEELIEVEAKNRLYTLLGERTRSACRPYPDYILDLGHSINRQCLVRDLASRMCKCKQMLCVGRG